MNRIDKCFKDLKQARKKAFVAYIAAGDPNLKKTAELVRSMEQSGVSVLELGVPFSDPLADGVVNQLAAARALKAKTTLAGILKMVSQLRKSGCELPLVLFTYFNPIHCYGLEKFAKDAEKAGVDGILNLDLPPEESDRYAQLMNRHHLHSIYLISPTTPMDRMGMIASKAQGFIYYVSREGVTGMRTSLVQGLNQRISLIRKRSKVPVVIGFGISTPEQVRSSARVADGCVVGSAIVNKIASSGKNSKMVSEVSRFVSKLTKPLR
jgi:tryptophan synthase alpha chain